ncbi:probable RNA methyltransferase bin3 [Cimex lectularius]|uniref:RNA methyltransferase n=1 Tax=Cimex lectularius TaxID=79782 RepID=A0A8I6RGT9_CIMLE|nr:probable RNA methyltransferase bin3 [Cimex lectularius]
MSAEVQAVVKVESRLNSPVKRGQPTVQTNLTAKRPKGEDGKFKFTKKRSQIFSGGKMFPPYKKRKKEVHIPPTKFLLGGNIRDPLNLNSFQDEEINRRMNAVTPESSPLPTPQHRKGQVEVIIPANIRDPLNLAGGEEDNYAYEASFLSSQTKRVKKKNKKKRQRSSTGSGKEDNADFKSDESKSDEMIVEQEPPVEETVQPVEKVEEKVDVKVEEEMPQTPVEMPAKPVVLELPVVQGDFAPKEATKRPKPADKESPVAEKEKNKVRKVFDTKDKIVSPVVPQPGAWAPTHRFRGGKQAPRPAQNTPNFKEKNKRFQYGNYNRYYGYRNPGQEVDPRLKLFAKMNNVFEGKDVLDIGCNTGHVTISLARDFKARKVVGLDIDKSLIDAAKANIRKKYTNSKNFPVSMPLVYGSLEVPGIPSSEMFPYNVSFVQGNYVLDNDVLIDIEQPQFDVILCLSVTKWLHLNWGDEGLKRAFVRMYKQLRPGGVLILEPQSWGSYKNKKNITETMWRNYSKIKLLPSMFTEHLLSEVGFSKCEVIGAPFHTVKAFQRPIKVYTKAKASETQEEVTPEPMHDITGQQTENLS